MKEITLRELQLLELEIAKEIKKVCEKNNINYFIIGGTLLGAVRHKGFIPWDDDMDIGMPTDDYNRFLEIAPHELDGRFTLQAPGISNNYANVFSKVRLNNTHVDESILCNLSMHKGIWVDIFPYDLVPQKLACSKIHMRKLQIAGKCSLLKHGYELNKITSNKTSRIFNNILKTVPLPKGFVDKRLMKAILSKHTMGEKNFYVERDGMFRGAFVFPQNWLIDFTELEFEDTSFKAPKMYDEYLTKAYGNYMDFPPEEEREKGHSISIISLDYPYDYYFNRGGQGG